MKLRNKTITKCRGSYYCRFLFCWKFSGLESCDLLSLQKLEIKTVLFRIYIYIYLLIMNFLRKKKKKDHLSEYIYLLKTKFEIREVNCVTHPKNIVYIYIYIYIYIWIFLLKIKLEDHAVLHKSVQNTAIHKIKAYSMHWTWKSHWGQASILLLYLLGELIR